MHDFQSTPTLRRQIRQLRRSISCAQRERWNHAIANHLLRSPCLRWSSHVASYLAQDGEADLEWLHLSLYQRSKSIYLPVLKLGTRLGFAPFDGRSECAVNRYGIAEPLTRKRWHPRFLSLVLVPLVGFDDEGNRLGMGGGYYDRSFAFARQPQTQTQKRPLLIGVGYEIQRCDALPAQPWDVPLDGVVTEKGLWIGGKPA